MVCSHPRASAIAACVWLFSAASGHPQDAARDLYGSPLPEGSVARLGTLRWRHDGSCDVAFSADGRWMTSYNAMRRLEILSLATGAVEAEVEPPGHGVEAAAFSPDGDLLMASGGSVRVWDRKTRTRVRDFPLVRSRSKTRCSRDGRWLAATEYNGGRVHVYDVARGIERVSFDVGSRIASIGLSPSGTVAAVSWTDTIELWDPQDG